jgi:hypothetical protein
LNPVSFIYYFYFCKLVLCISNWQGSDVQLIQLRWIGTGIIWTFFVIETQCAYKILSKQKLHVIIIDYDDNDNFHVTPLNDLVTWCYCFPTFFNWDNFRNFTSFWVPMLFEKCIHNELAISIIKEFPIKKTCNNDILVITKICVGTT